jgi:hypothetical protein
MFGAIQKLVTRRLDVWSNTEISDSTPGCLEQYRNYIQIKMKIKNKIACFIGF